MQNQSSKLPDNLQEVSDSLLEIFDKYVEELKDPEKAKDSWLFLNGEVLDLPNLNDNTTASMTKELVTASMLYSQKMDAIEAGMAKNNPNLSNSFKTKLAIKLKSIGLQEYKPLKLRAVGIN